MTHNRVLYGSHLVYAVRIRRNYSFLSHLQQKKLTYSLNTVFESVLDIETFNHIVQTRSQLQMLPQDVPDEYLAGSPKFVALYL